MPLPNASLSTIPSYARLKLLPVPSSLRSLGLTIFFSPYHDIPTLSKQDTLRSHNDPLRFLLQDQLRRALDYEAARSRLLSQNAAVNLTSTRHGNGQIHRNKTKSDDDSNNAVPGDSDELLVEEKGLKWVFNANRSKKALNLSCQRNRLRRQWAGAFTRALRRAGLDGKGRVRSDAGLSRAGKKRRSTGLHGTLEVQITQGAGHGEPTERLDGMMGSLVAVLVQRCRVEAEEERKRRYMNGTRSAGYSSAAGIARQKL